MVGLKSLSEDLIQLEIDYTVFSKIDFFELPLSQVGRILQVRILQLG